MSLSIKRVPIVITHDGGVKFTAQVRSHRVLVDQPVEHGGDDTAPSPIELLGAALGTCVALYVQRFCHARDLPSDGMRIEVEQVSAANPNRIGQFRVQVVIPAGIAPEYAAILDRVARSCPAHNTLAQGAEVVIAVETAPVVHA